MTEADTPCFSDLMVHPNPQQGWSHILSEHTVEPGRRADLFKAPHHGGESAFEERVFHELLNPGPDTLVCPWTNGGNVLPDAEDLGRLKALSTGVWLSGTVREVSVAPADPGPTQEWDLGDPGRVTARRRDGEDAWRVEAFGPAHQA